MIKNLSILVILLLSSIWLLITSVLLSYSANNNLPRLTFINNKTPISSYKLSPLIGDVTGDGNVSVSDIVYLINYLFKGGPDIVHETEEERLFRGDTNMDGKITVSDAIYLINYLFKGGCPPGLPCVDPYTKECYDPPCNR